MIDDGRSDKTRQFDVIVVGAGVAGLAFTLCLPPDLRVALLTKGALGESNTRYAQGGLAAAIGLDDTAALHEADTLAAGAGLCDPDAVRALVDGAPEAVAWLVGLGTRFDHGADGEPLLGREAAHSRRRVLHAGGDATGAEIERALVAGVRDDPAISIFEHAFAMDLIVDHGVCVGLIAMLTPGATPVRLAAPISVVAAGGAGQLWATTSNPTGATADGLAMALRAGVTVADLEFAQFHPTVLALPGTDPFLVSEAVRGEGAYLRGHDGSRFLAAGPFAHPLGELAPRDVVARAIQNQMAVDEADHVVLDLRHLDPDEMRARFPTIAAELARRGLDLATDPIPVAPAAHYFMGGIVGGITGTTSLPGLLALGEAACTGVHGANRLASNSLLEGLVFGLAAAAVVSLESGVTSQTNGAAMEAICRSRLAATDGHGGPQAGGGLATGGTWRTRVTASDASERRERLQRAMSRDVAVVRDAAGLAEAMRVVTRIGGALPEPGLEASQAEWELHNLVRVARAVIEAATRREESRGAHFRSDFPGTDPSLDGHHLIHDGATWRWGQLSDVVALAPMS